MKPSLFSSLCGLKLRGYYGLIINDFMNQVILSYSVLIQVRSVKQNHSNHCKKGLKKKTKKHSLVVVIEQ